MRTFATYDTATGALETVQRTWADAVPAAPTGKTIVEVSWGAGRELFLHIDREYSYDARTQELVERDAGGDRTERRRWPSS